MARIYYVGDWAVMLGPVFAETPFNHACKGVELFNYGHWLKNALESTGEHQCTSVPTWDFYRMGPGEFEKVIEEYDIFVFSDVEAKNFQLAPQFFDRSRFGKVLSFPDRVRLIVEAIHAGKSAMFLGGWLSFTGEMGKGGWGRTRLAEVLPVECLPYEDLRESTEGFLSRLTNTNHPATTGLDLATMPPCLGYNIVKPRAGCPVLATWSGWDDPMLAVGEFGAGRVLAYTSDPAPHWGCNFVYWQGYADFWSRLCRWVAGETSPKIKQPHFARPRDGQIAHTP